MRDDGIDHAGVGQARRGDQGDLVDGGELLQDGRELGGCLHPHDVAAGATVVEEAVDGVRQVFLPHIRREVAKGTLELPKVRAQPHLAGFAPAK